MIDASVAFKWLIPDASEDDVPAAKALLADHMGGTRRLAVPQLLFYEVGNILLFGRSKPRAEDVESALSDLHSLPLDVVEPTVSDARATSRLALRFGITYYDATYLALAESLDAELVTADAKLVRKARGFPRLRLLGAKA